MPELLSKETILVRDSAEAFVNDVLLPLIELLRSDHDVLLLAVAKARSDFSTTSCKLA